MQNEFFKMLLELNLSLIIGYVLYHLLFRKNNRHSWNRAFLIGWPILCLIIATTQINWTVWKTAVPQATIAATAKVDMPLVDFGEIAVTELSEAPNTATEIVEKQHTFVGFWQHNWMYLYWLGALIFGLIFIYRLGYLRYMIRYSTPIRKSQYTLLENPRLQSIFSFGSYIFNPEGKAIHPMILEHELVHVRQRHSLDLIWMELLVILNWFNPVIYLYRKHLKETHEFIADESVAKQFGLLDYARLLVTQASHSKTPALGLPFAAFTKKRLLTMKAKTNPWSRLRYGVVLPIFLMLMVFFAVQRIEKERPATLDNQRENTIDAQVKWGDLTCDCFKGELKGTFYCDIKTISNSKLEKI
ncbi:MAG: M56 family metallopeptidase, partial [Bacteroidota bacterium]